MGEILTWKDLKDRITFLEKEIAGHKMMYSLLSEDTAKIIHNLESSLKAKDALLKDCAEALESILHPPPVPSPYSIADAMISKLKAAQGGKG